MLIVAETALITENTVFTTPPTSLTAVQINAPSSPVEHVCGGEVYWTITFTVCEGWFKSGTRSGEIYEVSASAAAASDTEIRTGRDIRFRMAEANAGDDPIPY